LINAAKEQRVSTVLLAGWVSANNKLKDTIAWFADTQWLQFIYPTKNLYSTDNAAMVGINAYYKLKYGKFEERVGTLMM
jgi:tRNA A37 threonylcarbamoyltransferase TsaD